MGGKDQEGQRTDSIEVYNCSENKWATSAFKLRRARSGFAVAHLKHE